MSVRYRERNDGTPYWQVRFREHGRERSISWDNPVQAEQFDALIKQVGASRAREICRIAATSLALDVCYRHACADDTAGIT